MKIEEILERAPVIPVLVIEDRAQAVPLAEALLKGGLPVLEITLRTAAARDAALDIKKGCPEAVVGVGTVTTPDDLAWTQGEGLDFGVSPGTSAALIEGLQGQSLPFLPGTATVSEMMALRDLGYRAMKVFPAETCGGVGFLRSVAAVLPDVVFCPTGGINQGNLSDYLALSNVKAVGGSWIAPLDLVQGGEWGEIESRARKAVAAAGC